MASLFKTKSRAKDGTESENWNIQFMLEGTRKRIRLGKLKASKKLATKIKNFVERLLICKLDGSALEPEWGDYKRRLAPELHDKLAEVGLLEPRAAVRAAEAAKREAERQDLLGAFLAAYAESRSDVKPGTKLIYAQVRRNLLQYPAFGANKQMADITPGDCDEWRRWLVDNEKLKPNTVRKRCSIARQFFRAALRKRLIAENPFADMKDTSVRPNRERMYFVTRAETDKMLDACPDAEFRLLLALSRFGGLRCPSETLALRWGDINWHENTINVPCPKLEHLEGHERRLLVISPELREYLDDAFALAKPGQVFVIAKYRQANSKLRARFVRILELAGLTQWPRIFQNLRSTCESEMLHNGIEPALVYKMMGHTKEVSDKHYRTFTEADHERARQVMKDAAEKQQAHQAGAGSTEPEGASEDECEAELAVATAGGLLPESQGVPPGLVLIQ